MWSDAFVGTPDALEDIDAAQVVIGSAINETAGYDPAIFILKQDGGVTVYDYEHHIVVPLSVSAPEWVGKTFKSICDWLGITTEGVIVGCDFAMESPLPPGATADRIVTAGMDFIVIICEGGAIVPLGDQYYAVVSDVPVGLLVTELAVNAEVAIAITPDGTMVAWGDMDDQAPIINGVPGVLATKVSVSPGAGYNEPVHALALTTAGVVVAWGDNSCGQCDVPAGLTAIAILAGTGYSFAVRTDGTVVSWGDPGLVPNDPPML